MLKEVIFFLIFCLPVFPAFFPAPAHAETSIIVNLEVSLEVGGTSLVLSGLTSPRATVAILREGAVAATTVANDSGQFSQTLTAQEPGIRSYKLYATDRGGLNTATVGYVINLTAQARTSLDNIFLPPTITLDKTKVSQGENIKLSGYSYPSSTINLFFSPRSFNKTASSGSSGAWEYSLSTDDLSMGEYQVYAVGTYASAQSLESSPFTFKIEPASAASPQAPSLEELFRLPEAIALFDPNKDGKIELSELLDVASAWFSEFRKRFGGTCDLNSDGRCDVLDFSILMYYFR